MSDIVFKRIEKDKLESLSARNLLAYYRAERKRFFKFKGNFICGCCGEFTWNLYKSDIPRKAEVEQYENYLTEVKQILSTKEHVSKT